VWCVSILERKSRRDNNRREDAERVETIYRRKDICDERHSALEERLTSDKKEATKERAENKKRIDGIETKINSTLIFSIATLITLVIMLVTGRV
jgi:hypothetical protein